MLDEKGGISQFFPALEARQRALFHFFPGSHACDRFHNRQRIGSFFKHDCAPG
jgi:hypothetical protein